ncbi:MAG: hypothetical protein JO258_08215, partial [Alphaproteobacteria bacterium]|nr:hypothetical protein [Alphaproteobacteria bacterium]
MRFTEGNANKRPSVMWNLTPEYLQQVKEELKGRRAAIQARYADELKAL